MKNTLDDDYVGFEVIGDNQFKISYNSPLLKDHVLDYPSVSEDEKPGQMRKLLCAGVLGCFSGTVYTALVSRGVHVKSLKSTASATSAKNDSSLLVVKSIDIRVEIDIDDEDVDIFDKVKKIAEKGCLITRSIAPSIAVTHTIVRV